MENKHLNATCSICGELYHRCDSCTETKSFMPWRSIVDNINCYKIFLIIRDYTNKAKTKEETKIELEKFNLSGKFLPEIRNVIDEVTKIEKKSASKKNEIISEENVE